MASASETLELNGQSGGGERAPPDRPRSQRWLQGHGPININHYANKKSAAESMLDIALLMANASQLKAVMEQGPSFSFYIPLIVLISISLILQIGVGVLLIFLVKYDLNNPAKHAKLDVLHNLATGLVFIIVVVNIFITAFECRNQPAEDSLKTVSDKKRSEPLTLPLSTCAREPVKLGHRKGEAEVLQASIFLFPSNDLFSVPGIFILLNM
ncbi:ninjurin-1 [Dermochelys coriacea]|uniref:ninjurin-1 n=1 Tax=Dermochelys coriacea TaxID=27794 RepID=UPI0018E79923|nr:ninjurin-1 [Dermochelys coriacea]